MKFYPKAKKTLLLRQYVGEATDPDNGEKTDLAISMTEACPIITLPNGDAVIIEWDDLIETAKKYADEQNAQIVPKAGGTI